MNSHGNRARLGGVLVAVAAVLALVALPGLASGHRNHDGPADAGTVQSFDPETHVLTIDLGQGGEISGLVVRRTHIRCDSGRHRGRHGLRHHKRGHRASASHRRGGENGPGADRGGRGSEAGEDDSQTGGDEPGEDRGGRNLEPAEDHHGGPGGERCNAGDLTAGATVKIAELVLIDGKAIYKAVVLPKPPKEDEGEEETEAPPVE